MSSKGNGRFKKRRNTKSMRAERRESAEDRQAAASQRDWREQIRELDRRLGKGVGAFRERAKLSAGKRGAA